MLYKLDAELANLLCLSPETVNKELKHYELFHHFKNSYSVCFRKHISVALLLHVVWIFYRFGLSYHHAHLAFFKNKYCSITLHKTCCNFELLNMHILSIINTEKSLILHFSITNITLHKACCNTCTYCQELILYNSTRIYWMLIWI